MRFLEPVREVNQFTGFDQICQHTLGVKMFDQKSFHKSILETWIRSIVTITLQVVAQACQVAKSDHRGEGEHAERSQSQHIPEAGIMHVALTKVG